jgi:hypothetical protein
MKKLFVLGIAFALALGINVSAFSQEGPSGEVSIGDQVFQLEFRIVQEEGDAGLQQVTAETFFEVIPNAVDEAGNPIWLAEDVEGTATIFGAGGKADPFINYAIGFVDFGASSTFGFSISIPIVGITGANLVDASFIASVIDATGDGVSASPSLLGDPDGDGTEEFQINELGLAFTNAGVDVGHAFADAGPNTPGAPIAVPADVEGPIAGPAGPWGFMKSSLGVTLSGSADSIAVNGFFQVTDNTTTQVIPEPSTILLVGAGILGLGVASWRRKRQN